MKFSSRKNKITKFWANKLLDFQIWKPKHLFRLHGPLIMGVCLNSLRDPTYYQPVFHFHSLTMEFEVITLGLGGKLKNKRGANQELKVNLDDEVLTGFIDNLKHQYPLLEKTDLTFNDYLGHAHNCINGLYGPSAIPYYPNFYGCIVCIASFYGARDYAQRELDTFFDDLKNRNDYTMSGTLEEWRESILPFLDQETVAKVVEEQKTFYGLNDYKDYGLDFSSPKRLFDL